MNTPGTHQARRRAKGLLRLSAMTVSVAFAGAALAGCGSPAPAPEPAAAIDDSPAQGTIELWTASGIGDDLPELVADFEASNPDVTINTTVIPSSELTTRLQTAIAAGTTPDLAYLVGSTTGLFFETGAFAEVPEGLVDPSTFYKPAYDATIFDGASLAVPWYAQDRALFIRKDIMEKAGLTPPATWDEYLPFVQAMTKAGVDQGLSLTVSWDKFTALEIFENIVQAGGSVLNSDQTQWTLDDPKVIDGVRQYTSLFAKGGASPDGPGYVDVASMFVSGKLGAFQSGPFFVSSLRNAAVDDPTFVDDKLLIVPLPAGPAGQKAALDVAFFSVFKDAANPDAAWKLLRYLSEPATQVKWVKIRNLLPAVVEAAADPYISDDPFLSVFAEQLPNTVMAPVVPTWPEVQDILSQQAERVVRGETSAEEAMKEAQRLAQSVGVGN